MKNTSILLLAGDAGWLPLWGGAVGKEEDDLIVVEDVASGLREGDFLPDADAVIEAIRANAHLPGVPGAGVGVVIGLASHRCYAARVSTEGLPPRQLRQALPYRFETAVPFAVEDLVLDVHGAGDDRLVVATHFEPLQRLVHELEDAGIQVCGIAPLALLAAQSAEVADEEDLAPEQTWTIAEPPVLCTAQVPSVSEISCTRGASRSVTAWRWMPGAGNRANDADPPSIAVEETLRLARATVQRVVEEDETLWINLQQGPLASRHKLDRVRRPLTACLAAAALLLVASIGAMQVRAWQYRDAAARHDAQAEKLYEAAFPGEAVPVSMDRRLKTRLRELRGRQGLATPDTQLFDEANTLAVLRDLLARLPDDTRLVITDLRLSGDRIDLIGHARSHSEADTLATALRADNRFDVTPPSTENLPNQGVQFSLNLTPNPAPGGHGTSGSDLVGDGKSGPLVAERSGEAPRREDAADGGTP